MAKFIRLVTHDGEIGEQYLRQPPPDPAKFGLPTEDDGLRDDPMLAGSLHNGPGYRLDVEALRALGDPSSSRSASSPGRRWRPEQPGRRRLCWARNL